MQRNRIAVTEFECKLLIGVLEVTFRIYRVKSVGIDFFSEFKCPPLETVWRWEQWVVILEKVAVIDENLPDIEDLLNAVMQSHSLLFIVDVQNLSAKEAHGRTLDPANRSYAGCFSRSLDPHLGSGGKESICDHHRRRRYAGSGKPRIP